MSHGNASAESLVKTAAAAAADKKATDILILKMTSVMSVTDYFLICSGKTTPQTKAIAQEIWKKLAEMKVKPIRSAGEDVGDWILMDYGDFVVHIFTDEKRGYYELERLWRDAPQIDIGNEADEIDSDKRRQYND